MGRTRSQTERLKQMKGVFHVDKLIDKHVDKEGNALYLVRWQGHPPCDTWEPGANIHDTSLIDDFNNALDKHDSVRKNMNELDFTVGGTDNCNKKFEIRSRAKNSSNQQLAEGLQSDVGSVGTYTHQ